MQPYSSIDVTAAWKKLRFILSVRSDFHIINSLLIAVHAFVNLVSMSFSVDSTLLPRELKKLWKRKEKVIPIVITALDTVTEGLIKRLEDLEIRGRVGPFKLLHYWDRPEYWEDSWRLEGTCCHSNLSERPSANAGVKNSQLSKIIVKIGQNTESWRLVTQTSVKDHQLTLVWKTRKGV